MAVAVAASLDHQPIFHSCASLVLVPVPGSQPIQLITSQSPAHIQSFPTLLRSAALFIAHFSHILFHFLAFALGLPSER